MDIKGLVIWVVYGLKVYNEFGLKKEKQKKEKQKKSRLK